jgi:prepilin-type N-terminal cleavage/methylation domain-containing protein
MNTKKGFTLIELLVVIAIIALLLAIILPSIKKAKDYAAAVICKSNLRQWGYTWKMYGNDNEGKFPHWRVTGGGGYHRGAWIQTIRAYYSDQEKMLLCPKASRKNPVGLLSGGTYSINTYGGTSFAYSMGTPSAADIASGAFKPEWCSYGMNTWCSNNGGDTGSTQGRPASELWQTFEACKMPSSVPVMMDSMWRGGAPQASSSNKLVAPDLADQWRGYDFEMMHFAIPRHYKGRTNAHFIDLHVEDISLKGLWKQKWHQNYNTATLPGNAWPDWMTKYN